MDETQFRQKLTQYKDMVYRIAYTYLHNTADAEDISQETFLKYYNRKEPFSDENAEKAWLIRVTINACHNVRSSCWNSRRTEWTDTQTPVIFLEPEESMLYTAVFSLPDRYRLVVLLYYYEEYSIQEIAQLTGRKVSTIQTQLDRARKKLKVILTEKGGCSYEQQTIQTGHAANSNAGIL
jgi:RNA polymerase sigma-70 factor, ECF subfamily